MRLIAGEIFDQVLPYLNMEPQYSDNEFALLVSYAPNVVSKSVNEQRTKSPGRLTARVIGSGVR